MTELLYITWRFLLRQYVSVYFHLKILWNFYQFSCLTFMDGLAQMLEFNDLAFKDKNVNWSFIIPW